MIKFCRDCLYYLPPPFLLSAHEFAHCGHPRFISPVTGEHGHRNCSVQREAELDDYCGPAGKYFEPSIEMAIEQALQVAS